MKLKCSDGRRVMALPGGTVVHREDGSVCDKKLSLGNRSMTYITMSGKILWPTEIEALADEAERGYDPQILIDRPPRERS